jgi:hypothetical protein
MRAIKALSSVVTVNFLREMPERSTLGALYEVFVTARSVALGGEK